MNKGQQFWTELWQQGRISFHKKEVHPDLVDYWPALNCKPPATVLVPLCGKSLDMMWFVAQGYQVVGIELVENAVLQFFAEQQLDFHKESIGNAIRFLSRNLEIWVSDIFSLDAALIPPADAIYDRGALVALPKSLRAPYADRCLKWLKPGASVLLRTMNYEQSKIPGPPYSIAAEDVSDLYPGCQTTILKDIEYRFDSSDPLKEKGLDETNLKMWRIQKE